MIRIFLLVQALVFLTFGFASLLDPLAVVSHFGMVAEGRHAVYELRGVYGGISLGCGLLALSGAFKTDWARPALIFLMTYAGGYLIARLVGLALDGLPEPYYWAFIGYEAAVCLIAVILLGRLGKTGLRP